MIEIWLVVQLYMSEEGVHHKLRDERQPSLEVCWERAKQEVDRAVKISGNFEFMASCHIVKREEPA